MLNPPKKKHQRQWKQSELVKAVKMFMDGKEYDEIGDALGFTASAVQHKLVLQGFTREYRKTKLVGAVNS